MGRKLPSLTCLINICNALNVTPAYLLGNDLSDDTADPVQKAIDLMSKCSPREEDMMLELLEIACKHPQNKDIVTL